jgi:hypothetical protein
VRRDAAVMGQYDGAGSDPAFFSDGDQAGEDRVDPDVQADKSVRADFQPSLFQYPQVDFLDQMLKIVADWQDVDQYPVPL